MTAERTGNGSHNRGGKRGGHDPAHSGARADDAETVVARPGKSAEDAETKVAPRPTKPVADADAAPGVAGKSSGDPASGGAARPADAEKPAEAASARSTEVGTPAAAAEPLTTGRSAEPSKLAAPPRPARASTDGGARTQTSPRSADGAMHASLGPVGRYLRERGLVRTRAPATIPGRASFAFVLGAVLLFLFVVEAITGIALAAFYAPSTTDAWASVAYVQDQVSLGWLLRGLHFHAASAIVIVTGAHLVQTAVYGAYRKPRELAWWLGLLLLVLTLAWAVTGYVLRWDQAGFWANKVEVGIAAATPIVGDAIRQLALGGNDYGNLTLTRFYALHVLVLPAIVGAVTWGHVAVSRKLGTTSLGERERTPRPRWPDQSLRNAIAIAFAFAALLAYVISTHGVELAAPADPSAAYDARPLWYFRWLFELRELAGSAEKLVALATPAIVGGALVALPLIDRAPSRDPRRRLAVLGALVGLLAAIGGLTIASLVGDARDDELAKRDAQAEQRANVARRLAHDYGVPVTGAADVFFAAPMARGHALFQHKCASCHAADSKDRKGPVIEAGHGNRAWLKAFVQNPNGAEFWGRTKLAAKDAAMKSFSQMPPGDLDAVIELIYAESGATDADAAKRTRGAGVFDIACSDCHAREDGLPGASAPGLAGLGSRAYYLSFVTNPKSALHMGHDNSEMPRFDTELSLADRDALAEYLVWLRTATPAELAALGAP
jgi:ubiquinol-cytochrome c reductase cytochrome b subunit